nr:hypothetical protein GCM10020241_25860 [Streptoalloteichus tenebrarius]
MEKAPATSPATPDSTITSVPAPPPPTPATNAMLVTSPSIAPKTAGRSHPPETSEWVCPTSPWPALWICATPSL